MFKIFTLIFICLTISSCSDKSTHYDQTGYNYEADMYEEQGNIEDSTMSQEEYFKGMRENREE